MFQVSHAPGMIPNPVYGACEMETELNDILLEYKNTTDKLNEIIKENRSFELLDAAMHITQGMRQILDYVERMK